MLQMMCLFETHKFIWEVMTIASSIPTVINNMDGMYVTLLKNEPQSESTMTKWL